MQRIRRRIEDLGLWPRMALGLSLGFLVLFAAVLTLSEWALRDSARRIRNERLVIAQMAAGQIDRVLQQAVSELEQARGLADFDLAETDTSDEARALATTHSRIDTFASGVAFLDATGQVVLTRPPALYPPGADLSDLPHIARALDGRDVTVSAPFRDPLADQPVAAVTVPVSDGGRLLGLLSSLVNLHGPAITAPLQQAATLGHTGHAVLADHQGRALASTFELPFLSPGEHASFYRRALAGGQPVVDTVPFELDLPGEEPQGHLHVMAFAPLNMAPWGVAVGGDVDETFAGVTRLRRGLMLLGALALASVWAAALFGTRRLVRPVQRLTRAAQRIAGGDLETPLQATEGGEIGAMAEALEQMRLLLLSNIRELADLNETLEARVASRTEELRQQQALTRQLLQRAITAQEGERARISRELHDEIGQTLTAIQLGLERLARKWPAEEAGTHDYLDRLGTLTEQALGDLRSIIAALRPGVLDQLGLVPALGWVADHTLRPLSVKVTIDADDLQGRLPPEIETILFRIAQEAMSNVARHSQASHLDISLERGNGKVTMELIDDGQGFDPGLIRAAREHGRGLGLAGMQERASLAGGQVEIRSAVGMGTSVHVVIPTPAAVDNSPQSDDSG